MPVNNIMPDLDMTKNELEILWDYNVSLSESYVKLERAEGCRICDTEVLMSYVSPLLTSGVPVPKILQLARERFRDIFEGDEDYITEELINKHYAHFTTYSAADNTTRKNAAKYQHIIDSDRVQDTDVRKILESNIRSLDAQRLLMEQEGEFGTKAYGSIVAQLFKFVELKMKINKEIESGTTAVSIQDLIKISSPGELYTNDNGRTAKTRKGRASPKEYTE